MDSLNWEVNRLQVDQITGFGLYTPSHDSMTYVNSSLFFLGHFRALSTRSIKFLPLFGQQFWHRDRELTL